MKPYLDTEDTYYFNYEEPIKPKSKRDYAGIGAIIFTFFLIAIVTALTIYTAYQIAYGLPFEDIKKAGQLTKKD
jgi:hypothetical protein